MARYSLSGYAGRVESAGHDGYDYWIREWLNEEFDAVSEDDAIDKSNKFISEFLVKHPSFCPDSNKIASYFSKSEYVNHCKFMLGRVVWKKEFVPAQPGQPEIKAKSAVSPQPAHYTEFKL